METFKVLVLPILRLFLLMMSVCVMLGAMAFGIRVTYLVFLYQPLLLLLYVPVSFIVLILLTV